jgi:type I restriction enzyme R subunit
VRDEHLDKLQFKALIDAYIYSGREPIKMRFSMFRQSEVFFKQSDGDRIIAKMKEFVAVV